MTAGTVRMVVDEQDGAPCLEVDGPVCAEVNRLAGEGLSCNTQPLLVSALFVSEMSVEVDAFRDEESI